MRHRRILKHRIVFNPPRKKKRKKKENWVEGLSSQIFVLISYTQKLCSLIRKRNTTVTMDPLFRLNSFRDKPKVTLAEGRQDIKMICSVPKKTGKGLLYVELEEFDLADAPPPRVTGITTVDYGRTTVITVAAADIFMDSWSTFMYISCGMFYHFPKETRKGFFRTKLKRRYLLKVSSQVSFSSVKCPNDDLALNSDQHPDRNTRRTGSSTVGFGKIQSSWNDTAERVRKNLLLQFTGAGTISKDDVGHEVDNIEANGNLDMGNGDTGDSVDEYYKQIEERRASRTSADSSSPEPVDGNHQITYQMENIFNVEGLDGGATPDIDCDFDLTPHIGRTGGTTEVGITFSQASNNVEGQETSSSGHNGGSGAGSGSDESDQSTGSDGTDTNEGIDRREGGDDHDERDRDEGNDEDRRGVGDLESGPRRRVRNSRSTRLVAIFASIAVQSSSAIIALSYNGLSPLAKKLFTGVLVTNLVGFLCLYVAHIPSRYISPRAAEILVRVGGAASAFGFLLMMGIRLSLGIIIPACVVILAACVLSFVP
ncbi:hypothetical protein ACB092_04G029500 [Castanea dentata]